MQMVSVYRPASGTQVFNEMVNAIVDACNEGKNNKKRGVWGRGKYMNTLTQKSTITMRPNLAAGMLFVFHAKE